MAYPNMQLSNKVAKIPEALSIYINQLVYDQQRRGKDITVLSLGEAFFDIPMFDFNELDFARCYHYSDSRGIPELRDKISYFYKKHYAAEIDPNHELIISAGSKPIIYFCMLACLNAGDEVLIHEPGWLSYQEQAVMADAIPTFIPHHVAVADFSDFFTEKTKMLVINNPNNPAGRQYSMEELTLIYQQCRPKGIYVLVDEAYSDFTEAFHSMAEIVPDKDGIIIVNSLSKNMGMSGWRVGYAISSPCVIDQVLKLNQHLITCAPTLLQHYMAQFFDDITQITLPQVRATVEKRTRIARYLDKLGLNRMPGDSTFYFMVGLADFPGTGLEFAIHLLLRHQIAVVPGIAYGKSCERYIRVGIGSESEERICVALSVIRDLLFNPSYDYINSLSELTHQGFHLFSEK